MKRKDRAYQKESQKLNTRWKRMDLIIFLLSNKGEVKMAEELRIISSDLLTDVSKDEVNELIEQMIEKSKIIWRKFVN